MSTKVYDWVAYHARQTPDRLAMIDIHSGRRFTYADMQNRTLRLANGLAGEFGVARGDRVAVLANNTTDFLELEFACLKTGSNLCATELAPVGAGTRIYWSVMRRPACWFLRTSLKTLRAPCSNAVKHRLCWR